MRITFCGSGAGAAVNPRRGASSIHLAHGEARLLVDTGPGFMERMADSGLDADAVSGVVFSHLHFDHAMGVVELFSRLIVRHGPPVTVYGPRDTDNYIEAALGFARVNATNDFIRGWLDGVSVELTRPGDERGDRRYGRPLGRGAARAVPRVPGPALRGGRALAGLHGRHHLRARRPGSAGGGRGRAGPRGLHGVLPGADGRGHDRVWTNRPVQRSTRHALDGGVGGDGSPATPVWGRWC